MRLYAPPAETLVALVMPTTDTGVELLVVVPSPSCPYQLMPQHCTVPFIRTAHAWPMPAEMLVAVEMLNTGTGVDLSSVV